MMKKLPHFSHSVVTINGTCVHSDFSRTRIACGHSHYVHMALHVVHLIISMCLCMCSVQFSTCSFRRHFNFNVLVTID